MHAPFPGQRACQASTPFPVAACQPGAWKGFPSHLPQNRPAVGRMAAPSELQGSSLSCNGHVTGCLESPVDVFCAVIKEQRPDQFAPVPQRLRARPAMGGIWPAFESQESVPTSATSRQCEHDARMRACTRPTMKEGQLRQARRGVAHLCPNDGTGAGQERESHLLRLLYNKICRL